MGSNLDIILAFCDSVEKMNSGLNFKKAVNNIRSNKTSSYIDNLDFVSWLKDIKIELENAKVFSENNSGLCTGF